MRVNSNFPGRSSQGGMIQGAILFGLAILAIVIGAFALANRSAPSNTSNESNKVNASAVIKLGGDMADAINRYSLNYDVSTMVTDDSADGLYEPAKGLASRFVGPDAATTTVGEAFTFEKGGDYVGGAAGNQEAIQLANMKEDVCKQIERILYGTPITTPIPSDANGRSEGCWAGSGNFYYFKVIRTVP